MIDESIDYKNLPVEEQRELAVQIWIDEHANHTDPWDKPKTQKEIAEMFGRSQSWMSETLIHSGTLDKIEKRTRSNVVLARAMMQSAAPKIAAETIRSAMKKRDQNFEYITQQDRRDVLDRAGVRAEKQEASDVNIRFVSGGGFTPGMPAEVDE